MYALIEHICTHSWPNVYTECNKLGCGGLEVQRNKEFMGLNKAAFVVRSVFCHYGCFSAALSKMRTKLESTSGTSTLISPFAEPESEN